MSALCFSLSLFAQSVANLNVKVMGMDKSVKPGEKVIFESQDKAIKISGVTDKNGEFIVKLKAGHTYDIYVSKIGSKLKNNQIKIPELAGGAQYQDATLQIFFELPKQIILENLQFETAKWDIKASSYSQLDELVFFLKSDPTKKIILNGYTDNVGDPASNLELSQKRALAVKNYLISKGISEARIKTNGYGENYPIAANDSDANRKKNRRTEVVFV